MERPVEPREAWRLRNAARDAAAAKAAAKRARRDTAASGTPQSAGISDEGRTGDSEERKAEASGSESGSEDSAPGRLLLWTESAANEALLASARSALFAQTAAPRLRPAASPLPATRDHPSGLVTAPLARSLGQAFGRPIADDCGGRRVALRPEEAHFLLDAGLIEISSQGHRLSLEESWALLLRDVPVHHYVVYARLARLGYRITPHKAPEKGPGVPESQASTSRRQGMSEGLRTCLDLCRQSLPVPRAAPQQAPLAQRHPVVFPSVGERDLVKISGVADSLVPEGLGRYKARFLSKQALTAKKAPTEAAQRARPPDRHFHRPSGWRYPPQDVLQSADWAAYREAKNRWLCQGGGGASDQAEASTSWCSGLVAQCSGDAAKVLESLRGVVLEEAAGEGPGLALLYDVFLPTDAGFTIGYQPRPAFSLAACRAADAVPSVPALRAAQASLQSPTKLLLAVVDGSDVSFQQLLW